MKISTIVFATLLPLLVLSTLTAACDQHGEGGDPSHSQHRQLTHHHHHHNHMATDSPLEEGNVNVDPYKGDWNPFEDHEKENENLLSRQDLLPPSLAAEWKSLQDFTAAGGRCSTPDPTEPERRGMDDAVREWVTHRLNNRHSLHKHHKHRNNCHKAGGGIRGAPDLSGYQQHCNEDEVAQDAGAAGTNDHDHYHRILAEEETKTIATHVHIVRPTDSTTDGPFQIHESMQVLNEAFANHGFAFALVSTTLTKNTNWYTAGIQYKDERDMKKALRVGGATDLNIYGRYQGKTYGLYTTRLAGWFVCSILWIRSG